MAPSSGNAGTQVTVQGSGFAPNDITIYLDNQLAETMPEFVTADASGEFFATMIVPQLESEEYEVEAVGEASATTTFTVN